MTVYRPYQLVGSPTPYTLHHVNLMKWSSLLVYEVNYNFIILILTTIIIRTFIFTGDTVTSLVCTETTKTVTHIKTGIHKLAYTYNICGNRSGYTDLC